MEALATRAKGRPAKIARVRDLAVVCIPKNANTSIKRALLRAQGIEPPSDERQLHRHPALAMASESGGLFAAAFLRHPAARLVSCWLDKLQRDRGRATKNLTRLGFSVGMPFSEFVRRAVLVSRLDHHIRPQVDFLPDNVDFWGRVETIDRDWWRLRQMFDWLPALDRTNETARGKWQPYCDAESLRVIEEYYAADMELIA